MNHNLLNRQWSKGLNLYTYLKQISSHCIWVDLSQLNNTPRNLSKRGRFQPLGSQKGLWCHKWHFYGLFSLALALFSRKEFRNNMCGPFIEKDILEFIWGHNQPYLQNWFNFLFCRTIFKRKNFKCYLNRISPQM